MSTDETNLNRQRLTSRYRPLNEFWCLKHRGPTTTQTQQTDKLTSCPQRYDQQGPCQGQWDHFVCSPVCARLCGSWMVADDSGDDAFFSCHLSVRDYGRDRADRADRAQSCQGHTRMCEHMHRGPIREGCTPTRVNFNTQTHHHISYNALYEYKNTYYPIFLTTWSINSPEMPFNAWRRFRTGMIPHIKYLKKKKKKSCAAVSAQVCDLELSTALHTQLHIRLQCTERQHPSSEPELETGSWGLLTRTLLLSHNILPWHYIKALKPNETLRRSDCSTSTVFEQTKYVVIFTVTALWMSPLDSKLPPTHFFTLIQISYNKERYFPPDSLENHFSFLSATKRNEKTSFCPVSLGLRNWFLVIYCSYMSFRNICRL